MYGQFLLLIAVVTGLLTGCSHNSLRDSIGRDIESYQARVQSQATAIPVIPVGAENFHGMIIFDVKPIPSLKTETPCIAIVGFGEEIILTDSTATYRPQSDVDSQNAQLLVFGVNLLHQLHVANPNLMHDTPYGPDDIEKLMERALPWRIIPLSKK